MRIPIRLRIVLVGFLLMFTSTAGLLHAQTFGTPSTEALNRLAQAREMVGADRSFKVGYNPALEYSIDQLCGLKMPADWELRAPLAEAEPLAVTLPSSYDWRDYNGVTSVKDQGGCGGCWAFSTVGVLESQIKLKCGVEADLSEQYLISCNVDNWDCVKGGWFAHDYHLDLVPPSETKAGAVKESSFPYQASDVACAGPYTHPYKISSWAYIGSSSGVPSVSAIKQAIYEHGPVAVSICAGNTFSAYTSGIFDDDETCSGTVNHAVLLVGWKDDLGTDNGYWILKNSWGTYWGESGYMRIRYGVSNVGYAANYVEFSNCPASSLPTVTITASDATAVEGSNSGKFLVTRTGSTSSYLDVKYSITGTATNGTDYKTLSGTVRIPAGAASKSISVSPIDNTVAESRKTVTLTLKANSVYTVGSPNKATVYLYDNDTVVTVTATTATATENGIKGVFTFKRVGDTSGTLAVKYTLSGTAKNGVDYKTLSGSISFAVGAGTKTLTVTGIQDTLAEGTETVIVTISPNARYTVGSPATATVKIRNNS